MTTTQEAIKSLNDVAHCCERDDGCLTCAQKVMDVAQWLALEPNEQELIEALASLEHEQWMHWTQTLVSSEKLSPERLERWKKLWVPFSELSEEMKERDREWARKALKIFFGNYEEILK